MLARELGKFPHEVGRMPFADARDLAADMREIPARHVLLAIIAQWEIPTSSSNTMTPDDIRELRAMSGGVNG